MRGLLKFIAALLVALAAMLVVRSLGFTLCSVEGDGLRPHFLRGDRVVVNRWSYGLRTGDGRLFPYGRLARRSVNKGDVVALHSPHGGQLLLGICLALPGDTVSVDGALVGDTTDVVFAVPSLKNCDNEDCYYIERIGVVPEHLIIGRATLVLYNHNPEASWLRGFRRERLLLKK